MSELTLTVIRLGLLVLLWVFVFSVVGVLRSDLYGTRVVTRPSARARAAAESASVAAAAVDEPRRGRGRRKVPTTLLVTEGPLAGTSLPLRDPGVLVGRGPECTLVLDDDFASNRHARIYRQSDGWYVEDLNSTNGTFLGDNRLTAPVHVQAGTTLRIGQTVLELRR